MGWVGRKSEDELGRIAEGYWSNGGRQGLGSLRDADLTMLSKWWWRFKVERDGLWRNVIWDIHQSSRMWNFIPVKLTYAGPWKQIYKIIDILSRRGINLQDCITGEIGSGKVIQFWIDGGSGRNR
ncbi:hypothetical protein HanLR1_Chr10g0369461 [Helianthus annuus]|nr:hypothetical protein HanHA89_Chr10g0392051 [Helianthus annuus]KAJ0697488.1 hypothetical protein HanLR1_Chr10g0369461 [Helianthus annuus]